MPELPRAGTAPASARGACETGDAAGSAPGDCGDGSDGGAAGECGTHTLGVGEYLRPIEARPRSVAGGGLACVRRRRSSLGVALLKPGACARST